MSKFEFISILRNKYGVFDVSKQNTIKYMKPKIFHMFFEKSGFYIEKKAKNDINGFFVSLGVNNVKLSTFVVSMLDIQTFCFSN